MEMPTPTFTSALATRPFASYDAVAAPLIAAATGMLAMATFNVVWTKGGETPTVKWSVGWLCFLQVAECFLVVANDRRESISTWATTVLAWILTGTALTTQVHFAVLIRHTFRPSRTTDRLWSLVSSILALAVLVLAIGTTVAVARRPARPPGFGIFTGPGVASWYAAWQGSVALFSLVIGVVLVPKRLAAYWRHGFTSSPLHAIFNTFIVPALIQCGGFVAVMIGRNSGSLGKDLVCRSFVTFATPAFFWAYLSTLRRPSVVARPVAPEPQPTPSSSGSRRRFRSRPPSLPPPLPTASSTTRHVRFFKSPSSRRSSSFPSPYPHHHHHHHGKPSNDDEDDLAVVGVAGAAEEWIPVDAIRDTRRVVDRMDFDAAAAAVKEGDEGDDEKFEEARDEGESVDVALGGRRP